MTPGAAYAACQAAERDARDAAERSVRDARVATLAAYGALRAAVLAAPVASAPTLAIELGTTVETVRAIRRGAGELRPSGRIAGDGLRAVHGRDGWHVVDRDGNVWRPSAGSRATIDRAEKPATMARALASGGNPDAGTWGAP